MATKCSLVRAGIHQLPPNGPGLSYLLHQPSSSVEGAARSTTTRAALIAHPFGRLGGRKEDHVVAALAEVLAEEGYAVVRYDARGAGESEGSASWTCVFFQLPPSPTD
jgi:predicted alpha/beta-fold hydrolase